MRDLEPWGDAANPRHIDLHDGAGAALQILAEMLGGVEAFADCNRQGGAVGQPLMA